MLLVVKHKKVIERALCPICGEANTNKEFACCKVARIYTLNLAVGIMLESSISTN